MPAHYLKMEDGAWYITPPGWIMTAGFTGRCHRDEECHALAHATKRCMMGSGSYDNSHKLGLTGRHDDGPRLKLRRAAGSHESARLGAGWSLGVWWQTPAALQAIWCLSRSQLNNMKASSERIVSASHKKKKKKNPRGRGQRGGGPGWA